MSRKIVCDRCGSELLNDGSQFTIPQYSIKEGYVINGMDEKVTNRKIVYQNVDLCLNCIDSFTSWWNSCPMVKGALK